MASTEKVRDRIAEIISRPYGVRHEEIKWVMDQLGATERPSKHGQLFRLRSHRILINEHNSGKNTVPKYCVDDFRDLMIELGLY